MGWWDGVDTLVFFFGVPAPEDGWVMGMFVCLVGCATGPEMRRCRPDLRKLVFREGWSVYRVSSSPWVGEAVFDWLD